MWVGMVFSFRLANRNGVVSMSLAMVLQQNLLADAGMTVLIGVVVVFAVLLVLTIIFWLFGVVAGGGSKKSAEPKPAPTPKAPKAPAPAAPVAAPIVEDGISDEVVAAIAAAIAAMSDGTTRYAVRRISAARSQGMRPGWAAAGISDNTQPV